MRPRKTASRSKAASRSKTDRSEAPQGGPEGRLELVVIARPAAQLRARGDRVASAAGEDTGTIAEVLRDHGATLVSLFGLDEERVQRELESLAPTAQDELPDLSVFYTVDGPPDELEEIAAALRDQDVIEAAYVKPPAELARLNDMTPDPGDAPPVSPDFTAQQGYLDAAPGGIDARFAWTRPGGRGARVRIVDCEWDWRFRHEDLRQNSGGLIAGVIFPSLDARNHGTAVIGVMGGDRNGFGVTGICPDAEVSAAGFGAPVPTSAVIGQAALRLRAGDLLLLEIHRPGPRHKFLPRSDQKGYIAIEWWPDDWAAIKLATSKGIIVIEAAGNGAENLDDNIYNQPAPGFPIAWVNPFDRSKRDSGAIVVGAGAPPSGNEGPDRSRLGFSNFGALVDAQGWGREVTTCGYGDLQGGPDENLWYTERFSGTSSASPIVTGAVACVQGVLGAANRPLLNAAAARNLLRRTGSPQQAAPARPTSQRIGNRPNLRQLINAALNPGMVVVGGTITKTVKDAADKPLKDTRDTKNNKDNKDVTDTKNQKDNKDGKDGKDVPDTVKNTKDNKDNSDNKTAKDTRDNVKNAKDGKDNKDGKDALDKAKEVGFEIPGASGFSSAGMSGAPGGLEHRLATLEAAVAGLSHFIPGELRPDLDSSALHREADLDQAGMTALSEELQRQADHARQVKDDKDAEKPAEG